MTAGFFLVEKISAFFSRLIFFAVFYPAKMRQKKIEKMEKRGVLGKKTPFFTPRPTPPTIGPSPRKISWPLWLPPDFFLPPILDGTNPQKIDFWVQKSIFRTPRQKSIFLTKKSIFAPPSKIRPADLIYR